MSNAQDSFVEVPAGIAVFKAGEVGGELYIIESGQVELVPHGGASVALLGPGDVLGEMALLDNQPHTATALAKTKTRLLRIETALLPDVLRQNGEIGAALLRQLAARQLHGGQRPREPVIPPVVAKAQPAPRVEPATPVRPTAVAAVAAPTAMALRVTATGTVIALDPSRTEFLVGRPDPVSGATPEIDLGAFDVNRTLSRRHAKLLREDGQRFSVREDSATTNGTYLNGERLQTGTTVPLKPGDKLRFGSIEVELVSA